ncbi:hypothetical protein [Brevundimonas faecalis]|uniref:Uncharacterized protein n=1 Tax=Brevundimonas faecalis TaxID=947378 RepID=A0ABV2R7Q1_9CAUL
MIVYHIYQFGLASELIGAPSLACSSDEGAIAEMNSNRYAAPALELWQGQRLLVRKHYPPV